MKAILAAMWLVTAGAAAQETAKTERPVVDLVFVLDTTGSMGGMIEAAKQRIWTIANEVAKGKPAPRVRVGLVAYRDRGDEYVTKVSDLTEDLDKIYADLLALTAGGGGDGPEDVISGLSDAVDKMSWTKARRALKTIYLVGDAAPHEDYPNHPRLDDVMRRAVTKGLVVNTLLCGGESQAEAAWHRVARLGEGSFMAVPTDGGVVVRPTPFDGRIAELNARLEGTMPAFGRRKEEGRSLKRLAGMVSGAAMAAPAAAAERAVYKARAGGGSAFAADMDLAAAVASDGKAMDKLSQEELPDELKGLSQAERKAKVDRVLAERKELSAELESLAKKRAAHLAASPAQKTSFDALLMGTLRAQAAAKGIAY